MGRFINEDTYEGQITNPLSLNLYTYVQNNPLRYTDPSGNKAWEPYDVNELRYLLNDAIAHKLNKGSDLYKAYHDKIWERYGFASILNTNRYNYLFGLLTGTSTYKNSAGNASWAREELIREFFDANLQVYILAMAMDGATHVSTVKTKSPTVTDAVVPKGTGNSAQIPRTGAEWNEYYKSKYGNRNVTWVTELKSYNDILSNPKALWGKSANEIGRALGDGWTRGTYGSAGTGWKFTNGDKSVFYHPGGGVHDGSYYGFSSGQTGKVKVVGSDYKPLPGDKATIIHY